MKKYYYYLHTNGSLIGKPPIVVDNDPGYFDSPFVKHVWEIDLEDRATAWKLVIEALALNANIVRIKELVKSWALTEKDLPQFIMNWQHPTELQRNGMDKFIKDILGKSPDAFWDSLLKKQGGES